MGGEQGDMSIVVFVVLIKQHFKSEYAVYFTVD
jgi:hypothetical protein